jgi:hypothetical protein
MTSLGLLQYSDINDNSSIDMGKKKEPKHNTTIKKRSPPNSAENVQNMLKLINNSNGFDSDNDDSLADFNPPPRAELPKTKDTSSVSEKVNIDYEIPTSKEESSAAGATPSAQPPPRQYQLPMNFSGGMYGSDVEGFKPNYYHQLEHPNNSKDQLMEKLNYMIHLLEEQKDEKTGHVMEEVILYSFLGVFIIFIVDSFARAGKYTR